MSPTPVTPLHVFLLKHRVGRGCEHTHTSLARPAGAFYVGGDDEERFYELYQGAVERGDDVHLTEKHKDMAPLLVDLDLRYPAVPATDAEDGAGAAPLRRHEDAHVEAFLRTYMDAAAGLVRLPEAGVEVYVMEKPRAVATHAFVKDGIHIMVPGVVVRRAVQHEIRRECLERVGAIFRELGAVNPAKDIYDEAVLGGNNWMMYGSRKPEGDLYAVTRTYRYFGPDRELERLPDAKEPAGALVQRFSIRNKYQDTPLREEARERVERCQEALFARAAAAAPQHQRQAGAVAPGSRARGGDGGCHDTEFYRKLVGLLKAERSDRYDDWIRVGLCLRNTDVALVGCWDEFSSRSSKYRPGECQRVWHQMSGDGTLGVGTLRMWARQDDAAGYAALVNQDLKRLIRSTRFRGSHHDVAKVVHCMYGHRFVCASIRANTWYEFRDHRWRPSDSACALRRLIPTDVWKEYMAVANEYNCIARSTDDEEEQKTNTDNMKLVTAVSDKLKDVRYKEQLLKECRELFYEEKFEERLDAHHHLIGFENGVYDIDKDEFRDGRPEDYLTFSTGIDFVPFDPEHPAVADIDAFVSQIQPKPHMRRYVMTLLATFLSGQQHGERFHIWTGVGGNGKSRLIELFEACFGDYCCKLPISMLTQKRIASNAANSELALSKGKRFACMQEPGDEERLNVGLMKELTGGDKITARNLYSSPVEFKPQFNLLLMCNQLPAVSADDNGTWRRIRVVSFDSKFVSHPNPDCPDEFPIDPDLVRKFDGWKSHFMGMLLQYHRSYLVDGLEEPEEVLKCTRDYQNTNDYLAHFSDACLEAVPGESATVDAIFEEFKEWARAEHLSTRLPRRRDFQLMMEKRFGKAVGRHTAAAFPDMRLNAFYRA